MADSEKKGEWTVNFNSSAKKGRATLPPKTEALCALLARNLELKGPTQNEWPNYGSLHKNHRIPSDAYHCHIKKGKPTYVACWQVISKTEKTIKVFYVGTHEKAPYKA